MKSMKPFMIAMLIIAGIIITIGLVCLIIEFISENRNYGNICTALVTIGLLITAIYAFYENREATRMQTSMDFCAYIYPILQSEEFVEREKYLIQQLSARLDTLPCSFEQIDNDTLRKELYRYCECLNGIGIMLHEHMIDPNVIVPYIGTKTTILYELIQPYLILTRNEQSEISYIFFNEEENQKVQGAASLYFVHYELLALQMRYEGLKLTKKLNRKLYKSRKQNHLPTP